MPTVHSLYLQKEECAEHLEERIGFPHSLNLVPFIRYKVRPPDAHGDSGTPDTTLTWGERKRTLFSFTPQGSRTRAQTLTSVTFDSFKNFSFGPFPINKEYIYGNLGDELVQKL